MRQRLDPVRLKRSSQRRQPSAKARHGQPRIETRVQTTNRDRSNRQRNPYFHTIAARTRPNQHQLLHWRVLKQLPRRVKKLSSHFLPRSKVQVGWPRGKTLNPLVPQHHTPGVAGRARLQSRITLLIHSYLRGTMFKPMWWTLWTLSPMPLQLPLHLPSGQKRRPFFQEASQYGIWMTVYLHLQLALLVPLSVPSRVLYSVMRTLQRLRPLRSLARHRQCSRFPPRRLR